MRKLILYLLLSITLLAQQETRVIEVDWSQAQYWPQMQTNNGNQGGNGNGHGPGGNGNGNNGNGNGNGGFPVVPESSAYGVIMFGGLLIYVTTLRRPKR